MRRHRPVFARIYSRLSGPMDRGGMAEYRDRTLAGLSGRVLVVGAGDGANFRHYPSGVSHLVAVEPEPYLRARALERAETVGIEVEIVDGVAEDLGFADGSFDAAVVTLTLCSVADQGRALREIYRVLRPGGELRLFEHVRAESASMRAVQRTLDATVWPLVAGGCHTGRDTQAAIEATGFQITELDALRFPDVRLSTSVTRHLLGVAIGP
ncbi:MAG TPA: class I SAM-dependent methyltransferase [Jiangellaceae bacterium]|nr:class I SAM-dependent methyltransferase [Jiangellaceae bacterium]